MLTVAAQWQMSLNPIWRTSNSCCFSRFKFGSCNRTDCMCVRARVCVLGLYTGMFGVWVQLFASFHRGTLWLPFRLSNRKSPQQSHVTSVPDTLSFILRAQADAYPSRKACSHSVARSLSLQDCWEMSTTLFKWFQTTLKTTWSSADVCFALTLEHKSRTVRNYFQLKAAAGAFHQ